MKREVCHRLREGDRDREGRFQPRIFVPGQCDLGPLIRQRSGRSRSRGRRARARAVPRPHLKGVLCAGGQPPHYRRQRPLICRNGPGGGRRHRVARRIAVFVCGDGRPAGVLRRGPEQHCMRTARKDREVLRRPGDGDRLRPRVFRRGNPQHGGQHDERRHRAPSGRWGWLGRTSWKERTSPGDSGLIPHHYSLLLYRSPVRDADAALGRNLTQPHPAAYVPPKWEESSHRRPRATSTCRCTRLVGPGGGLLNWTRKNVRACERTEGGPLSFCCHLALASKLERFTLVCSRASTRSSCRT